MEWTVKMDEKGRIVILSEIRNALGIEKRAKLVLEIRDNQIVIMRIETQLTKLTEEQPEELKSFLQNTPKP